jgi:NifU-like protein involved in Fe-S cluster formation
VISPNQYNSHIKGNSMDTPYHLTKDFNLHLNKLKNDLEKISNLGLKLSDYNQYSKVLKCYSAAESAIKKLTN